MSGVPDILAEVAPRRSYFLGLDFSTQQVVENLVLFFSSFALTNWFYSLLLSHSWKQL